MDTVATGLGIAFFVIALAYAAVGQAGASSYIAAMALSGFSPLVIKPTALALNLMVAAIGTAHFLKVGRLSWRNVYPFAILGFPFSVLGGSVHLPERVYHPVVGLILIVSAIQMARSALRKSASVITMPKTPPLHAALITGAVVGFVSGITGSGGGIFLAPVILARNWGTAHQTAATTAVYNLMNSTAALIGACASWNALPNFLPWWLLAVAAGGSIGALIGSRYLSACWIRIILSVLLMVSGLKLIW
ncbi:sulfite exporter TauE/SafE family protein [Ensifer sp. IC4062]|nr:sulfite exporter TauE/SafE family protein [Ensifer sp. IC4062]MCA1440735.1 sulfite exporter TauE/SafE family protein [Ensifer sp. IC4062]